MSIELVVISILIGFMLGVFSGLIPGIHTNTFAMILVATSPFFIEIGIQPKYIAIVILSNSITHTFHDIIPSIFLGAPESDMALAVLPGHRLLLDGHGAEAIRLSAIGSAGSIIISLMLVFPISLFFSFAYSTLRAYIVWILIFIVIAMILSEKGDYVRGDGVVAFYKYKLYALIVFVLSGILGKFAFETEHMIYPIIELPGGSVLLPLLSGLFGASHLIISLFTTSIIPLQHNSKISLKGSRIINSIIKGSIAGSIVAWIPGISSAIATVILNLFKKEEIRNSMSENSLIITQESGITDSAKEFIIAISSVNTANAMFGIFALYIIGRTRSGAMVAIDLLIGGDAIDISMIILFLFVISFAALLSYFSTIKIGDNIHHILSKIEYSKISILVIISLIMTVIIFTGVYGFLIFIISTTIGMLSSFMKIRKSHAMGVILLPVIIFFMSI
ncbi:MAG: tripartite tricarboxylate transporter permease [Methanosarcinaceae archaeon]|nr:tripartite tricarboxylate transporter permease [Methanosarcinaceae archaeon]